MSPTIFPFAPYTSLGQAEAALKDWPQLSAAERADLCGRSVELGFPMARLRQQVGCKDYELSHLLRIARRLNQELKHWLHDGRLNFGQARALVRLPIAQQEATARTIVQKRLPVRAVEALVRGKPLDAINAADRAHFTLLSEKVGEIIGYPVTISPRGSAQRGSIVIDYDDLEGFEAVMHRLRVPLDELL